MNDTKHFRTVFSKKLANELVAKGYAVDHTEINYKFPKFYVFIFEAKAGLEDEIRAYYEKRSH